MQTDAVALEILPNDYKAVIKTAAAAVNNCTLCHNCYKNSAALSKLVNEHNVQLREYPPRYAPEVPANF